MGKTKQDGVSYAFTEGQFVRLFHGRPETVLFTVENEARKLVAGLTPKERAYITDPARGEYRGFAAWHDVCDANMMLPGSDDDSGIPVCDEAYVDFCNAVMTHFNTLLL